MRSTINSDSVAQDQLRAFVERIMRMREEARAINADVREIYAEAKANGFDKTVLGKVVLYVEKRATKAAELLEAETVFDLYLEAFDGAVGTRVATHTHEAPRRTLRELRGVFAGEPRKHIELISEPAAPATTPPGAIAADLSDEGTNIAQPEPLSSDTQSTAALKEVQPTIPKLATVSNPATAGPQGAGGVGVEQQAGTQARPVDTISEPDKSARPSGDGLAAPAENFTPIRKQWAKDDKPHPDCLKPELCGGFSNLKVCQSCREAAQLGQVA